MKVLDRAIVFSGAIVLVALSGSAAWLVWPRGGDPFADCRKTRIMGGASAIGGPFTLVSEDGKTVTDKQVIDEPSLLYFGYTFCPDICPVDAQRNAEAAAQLAERGVSVKTVFISVDPKRDTPKRLKEWTDYIDPKMLGLTGSAEQIAAAAKEYRVFYQVPKNTSKPDYTVGHSTKTYLVLPKTGFVELYDSQDSPKAIADSVACFASHA